jgi:hypothetical protein
MPLARGYTLDSIGVTLGWPLSPLPKVNAPSCVGLVVVVTLSALGSSSFGDLPMRLMAAIASHGTYPVPLLLAP